ncbi:hypothetical protein F5Y04DRAFT_282808 [Hypomontagnella monticulosa]|nr:hypothetical protein F5Y04DRAFT_282808 [Hypomontagnella monticulosa]
MLGSEADGHHPLRARIAFPPGWSSERLQDLNVDDFGRIPEELLKNAIRKFPFSPDYAKIRELNVALLRANERPPTPPSYVPPGWTIDQAKAFDFNLIAKLSEEEHHLWAAGKTADDVRRAQKQGKLTTYPPTYIPAGWTIEQAISPSFELLSQLSNQDLTKFMEARNKATQLSIPTHSTQNVSLTLSPLVQTLQRAGFPPWGFVLVRTDYRSESQWGEFQRKLDAMCDAQLDEERGEGLERVRGTLEFKMIDDPRLADVDAEEARRHFHIAKSMGGVASGLDMGVLLLADAGTVESVLKHNEVTDPIPYITAVDVTDPGNPEDYPGSFKVSVDSLLCEFYPKLSMGVSPRALYAMMDKPDSIWTGDDQ